MFSRWRILAVFLFLLSTPAFCERWPIDEVEPAPLSSEVSLNRDVWETIKWGLIEHAAQVLEMNQDKVTYYFSRDMDYAFDVAWLLDPEARDRIHRINVSTGAWKTKNATEYLRQEGLIDRADGREAVLLDIGMEGSIPEGIKELSGNKNVEVQLLYGNNPDKHFISRTFQTTVEPLAVNLDTSCGYCVLQRSYLDFIESLPMFNDSNKGYEQMDSGRWVPKFERWSGERKWIAKQLMQDLVYFVQKPEVVARFKKARADWKTLAQIGELSSYSEARARIQSFVKNHERKEVAEAMVRDFLRVKELRGEEHAFSEKAFRSQGPKVPLWRRLLKWFPNSRNAHFADLELRIPLTEVESKQSKKLKTDLDVQFARRWFPEVPEEIVRRNQIPKWMKHQVKAGKWEVVAALFERSGDLPRGFGTNYRVMAGELLSHQQATPEATSFALRLLEIEGASYLLLNELKKNPALLDAIEARLLGTANLDAMTKGEIAAATILVQTGKDVGGRLLKSLLKTNLSHIESYRLIDSLPVEKRYLAMKQLSEQGRVPFEVAQTLLNSSKCSTTCSAVLGKQKGIPYRNLLYQGLLSGSRVTRENSIAALLSSDMPEETELRAALEEKTFNIVDVALKLLDLPKMNQKTRTLIHDLGYPKVKVALSERKRPSLSSILEGSPTASSCFAELYSVAH